MRLLEAMGYRRLLYVDSTPFLHGRSRYLCAIELAD